LFPDATVCVIADAGHWLHVQQPGVFIERVEQFCES
jgi:pimeloyl-ACP methyl ester carboxylesterase